MSSYYTTADPSAIYGNSTILLSTILTILVIYKIISTLRKYRTYPPGPWGLPLVGYAPFMTKTPHVKLEKLAKKYGNVMLLNVMGQPVIHLNGYQAIREAFVEKGKEFAGKPQDNSLLQWVANKQGLIQSEGAAWKVHRRFAVQNMKDLGLGKLRLEAKIHNVVNDLLKIFEDTKGEPIEILEDISFCTANVICSLLFDKHYQRYDPEFLSVRRSITFIMNSIGGTAAFLANPLSKIVPVAWIPGYGKLGQAKSELQAICSRIVTEHQKSFNPQCIRDYVDAYLDEQRRLTDEGTLDTSSFTVERLIFICLNLCVAGTEPVSTTLYWGFKFLIVYPEIRKKVQAEIDQVVGKERPPSTLDRPHMPFTEAFIAETHRFGTIVGIIPVHSNPEEATLAGFTIPKRSVIMGNLWSVNMDSEFYDEPELFRPERFLESDGSLKKIKTFMPFSIGIRTCPGEALAKMELFLFLTSVLQRFNLEEPEGDPSSGSLNSSYVAFVRRPDPYKLSATLRD